MVKDILYIGMDESNHGETKSRIGEIIVASYSYDKRFWEYKKHPNRRNYSRVSECLKKGVSYIYTILPHEIAKSNYSNLPLVAPFFVKTLFPLKNCPKIKLGLDGRLRRRDKKRLIEIFAEEETEISVVNFIKDKGVHYGPELIYLSHIIANNLINKSMLEIAHDEYYYPFDILNL